MLSLKWSIALSLICPFRLAMSLLRRPNVWLCHVSLTVSQWEQFRPLVLPGYTALRETHHWILRSSPWRCMRICSLSFRTVCCFSKRLLIFVPSDWNQLFPLQGRQNSPRHGTERSMSNFLVPTIEGEGHVRIAWRVLQDCIRAFHQRLKKRDAVRII